MGIEIGPVLFPNRQERRCYTAGATFSHQLAREMLDRRVVLLLVHEDISVDGSEVRCPTVQTTKVANLRRLFWKVHCLHICQSILSKPVSWLLQGSLCQALLGVLAPKSIQSPKTLVDHVQKPDGIPSFYLCPRNAAPWSTVLALLELPSRNLGS